MFRSLIYSILIFLGFAFALKAQDSASTHLPKFSILASGHWYGAHANAASRMPASSLFAFADSIRKDADLILALGDVLRDPNDPACLGGYLWLRERLGNKVKLSPGNHDYLEGHQMPQTLQGGHSLMTINGNLLLFLDSERILRNGCGEALDFLKKPQLSQSRHVLIFSHHLLWALMEPDFAQMDEFANASSKDRISKDSLALLKAAIDAACKGASQWWFSGDVGTPWSLPVFADSLPGKHFFAAGIGDNPSDLMLRILLEGEAAPQVAIYALGSASWGNLWDYNLEYWEREIPERRKDDAWGYKLGLLLSRKSTWLCLFVGVLFGLGMSWLRKVLGNKQA